LTIAISPAGSSGRKDQGLKSHQSIATAPDPTVADYAEQLDVDQATSKVVAGLHQSARPWADLTDRFDITRQAASSAEEGPPSPDQRLAPAWP
jgi:hypothetical protein